LRHAPQQPVAARGVLAVSGVTGGCRATTIAINLAYEIAHQFDLSCNCNTGTSGLTPQSECFRLTLRHSV